MAATVEDFELGLRDGAVDLGTGGSGDEVILLAPDDEHGHFERAELAVEQAGAREHGVHVAADDPGVTADEAEDIALDEGGDVRGARGHEQVVEGGQLGRRVGLEEGGVPGEGEACTGAVEDDEAANALRLVEGDAHDEPSTHRPTGKVGAGEAAVVEEGFDGGGFFGDGVGGVGPVGAAVAGQVEGVDAVMVADELGHEVGPVFGSAAESVDQDNGRAGAAGVVVDADAGVAGKGDVRVVGVDAVEAEAGLGGEPEQGEGAQEGGGDDDDEQDQDGEEEPA